MTDNRITREEAVARVVRDFLQPEGFEIVESDYLLADRILAALDASTPTAPEGNREALARVLTYAGNVRGGNFNANEGYDSDAEWHVQASVDTGTSYTLPGRLYVVQCEWCPAAFAAHTKADAMALFREHEAQQIARVYPRMTP